MRKLNAMTFGQKVMRFNTQLRYTGNPLPPGIRVMNPFTDDGTMEIVEQFYAKFYNDNRKRHLVLGINPGRFGGGVTGIPFTDTKRLVSACNIPFEGKQSHEPSSVFIYEMIDAYGGPRKFYNDFFINSPSPLGFTKVSSDGKETNYNYYDSPALIKAVKGYMIESIRKLIELGVDTNVCFCFGTGKNFQFLSKLNEEHKFFGELIPLEHPRYIMQYKSKSRHEYVGKYLSAFSKIK